MRYWIWNKGQTESKLHLYSRWRLSVVLPNILESSLLFTIFLKISICIFNCTLWFFYKFFLTFVYVLQFDLFWRENSNFSHSQVKIPHCSGCFNFNWHSFSSGVFMIFSRLTSLFRPLSLFSSESHCGFEFYFKKLLTHFELFSALNWIVLCLKIFNKRKML